ncbi:uncharacterized protein PITG_09573 [Phytophthora infestans T30-4]|uniref:Uncharacterized protein n=1 Tax=Phytophthora infestans (strain T30-4) TaxID=403677 RepID=D0NCB1_PHYIT|nr:uncharacterized protein PITG_09573 [Phytophthora infestans T30-4]EEY55625.1 conserved hypothetical protein [Phytophthora infestans T30-4]|eukprot:XP_002903201.1 conserved hypothetical protein [Phytophthora infestans T30-4]
MEPDESNAIRWAGQQLGNSGPEACAQAHLLSTKRVQLLAVQDAVLRFLASLPHQEWTVIGCQYLLETGGRWNAVAVASLLDKVMAQALDKTLMLAEICWIRSVSPSARALASNTPVTVSSVLNDNMLFAAEDYFLYDETRRCVFCWVDEWEADQSKEIWRFVPASPDFYILNVYSQEYLLASDVAASESAEGYGEKRAFTWLGDSYLISPPTTGSAFRRLVLTSSYRPLDQSWNECHKWKIKRAAPSLLERGLDAFFAKDYAAAVDLLAPLLETKTPSAAGSIKIYWYRMVANLKLQNKELFREDADRLGKVGGCPKYFREVFKDVLGDDLYRCREH